MTKLEAARKLAEWHFQAEPDLKRVFLLEPIAETDAREPIKLLEVVEGAIELGILPVAFPPDARRGVEYVTYIVEVSPREFDELSGKPIEFEGQLWTVGEELYPAAALAHAG